MVLRYGSGSNPFVGKTTSHHVGHHRQFGRIHLVGDELR